MGLEPTTLRLRVSCSTDWASRADLSYRKNLEYKFYLIMMIDVAMRSAVLEQSILGSTLIFLKM